MRNIVGLQCKDDLFSRIGFSFNVGVSDYPGDYLNGWDKHMSASDLNNSTLNAINSVKEFLNRSISDDGAIFILWLNVAHMVNNFY